MMSQGLTMAIRNIIPFSGWTTMATAPTLLPTNVLVSHHVVQHLVTGSGNLQALPTHTQV